MRDVAEVDHVGNLKVPVPNRDEAQILMQLFKL
jgi:hypothetical protein